MSDRILDPIRLDKRVERRPSVAVRDDDRPGMPFEDRIRAVVRREYAWARGMSCCVWPSKVITACLDQPGARPSETWVVRPERIEDLRAARVEHETRWDDRTPAMRIVSDELRACRLRRSAYYTGG